MIGLQNKTPIRRLMMLGHLAGGIKTDEVTTFGNPITFLTDLARPLKSLEIPFSPRQSGSGDPSPSNVRPIVPWEGLTVGRINGTAPVISDNAGMENVNGEWKNTGTDTKTKFDAYIQLYKGSTYIKGAGSKSITSSGVYSITFNVDDAGCNRIVFLHSGSRDNLSVKFPFELPQGTYTISFNVVSANPSVVGGLAIKDIFLVEGSTVDRTETDISFPSPVYGGTLDAVTGVLTVTHVCVEVSKQDFTISGNGAMPYRQTAQAYIIQHKPKSRVDWSKARQTQKMDCAVIANPYSETTYGNYIGVCFYDTNLPTTVRISQDLYDSLQDGDSVSVCYEIDEPFGVQLTPAQITALVGNNTIWSDANGSMTAVYLKKR